MDCVFPLRPENRDKRNALPKGKACRSCRSVSLILSISFPNHPSPDPPFFIHHSRSKKKVRRRHDHPAPPHLIPFASRNAMDNTQYAAPVPAPAMVNRAFTTKSTTFPAAIRMRTTPLQHPHTLLTGPADPFNTT